jgi:hypothetical protein
MSFRLPLSATINGKPVKIRSGLNLAMSGVSFVPPVRLADGLCLEIHDADNTLVAVLVSQDGFAVDPAVAMLSVTTDKRAL